MCTYMSAHKTRLLNFQRGQTDRLHILLKSVLLSPHCVILSGLEVVVCCIDQADQELTEIYLPRPTTVMAVIHFHIEGTPREPEPHSLVNSSFSSAKLYSWNIDKPVIYSFYLQ